MTLVTALACKNGIVMASDGQATVRSAGGPVRVEAEKIFKINETTLFGASGEVGHIQKSFEIVKGIKELERGELTLSIKTLVKNKLSEMYAKEIEPIMRFHRALGISQLPQPPIADIIIAKILENGNPIIWHISPDCRDVALEEIGYGCTGIGDIFAHTLLKGYKIKELNIEEGKLIAYNTLKMAIEVGAYGLGEPIYIWTLTKDEGAKKLSREEIMALKDTWIMWKEAEKELFKKIPKKEIK